MTAGRAVIRRRTRLWLGLGLGLAIAGVLSAVAVAARSGFPGAVETCPPPLKLAAGACVRECPGGYEDRGQVCIYRNQAR